MKKHNLLSIINKKMLILSTVILFAFSVNAQDWEEVIAFEPAQSMRSIKFANELVGYTNGALYNGSTYNIHKTTDGGNTWIDQSSGYANGMSFNDTYVFSEDTVMMCGLYGIVIYTTDGGENWISNTVTGAGQLSSISFVGETGYVTGDNGYIFKTDNMGESWTQIASPTGTTLNDIYFITEDFGFVNGWGYIGYTHDGGQTWQQPQTFPSPYPAWALREFSFVNESVGYVCGDAGLVFKTIDGGKNWELMDNLPDEDNSSVQSIVALDENTVYTCGHAGTIMHTLDGGDNWELMSSSSQNNLISMDFTPGGTGFICTWFGEVLSYTNPNPLPTVLNLTATVSEDDIALAWDAPATGTPNSFNVYRDNEMVGNTTNLSYDDMGLAPGTYEYYVTAVYDEGESGPSNTATAVVEELVLAAPTNLSSTSIEGDVALAWDAPATGTPNSYNIYRDNEMVGNTTNLSYDDMGLAPGTYEYYVTAVYDEGESGPSNTATAVVEELVLAAPTNLSSTSIEGDVALAWDAPATGTPNSYNIYRDNEMVGNTTNLSYDDLGLASGIYEYYVIAIYDEGESDPSNTVTKTVTITGVEEQLTNTTQLYPNPATDQVNISSDYTMQSLTVYNFAGQVVLTESVDNTTFRVNTSNFDTGIYLFQIETKEGRIGKRIIIE